MGVKFPSDGVNLTSPVTLVTTATTIILTSDPISQPLDGATIILLASLVVTWGTGIATANIDLLRGTLVTSPVISSMGVSGATRIAGNQDLVTVVGFDQPGAIGAQQYSLAVGQLGASANGTVSKACLILLVF